MSALNLEQLMHDVMTVAEATGSFVMQEFKRFNHKAIEYKGPNDLVSYVDKTAERLIVDGLSALVSGAGFITEEVQNRPVGDRYNWIVDPLDGTTNFSHGLPCFCISIALLDEKEVVCGVVYELNAGEMFSAWKNGGAYMNGKKIHVSSIDSLSHSLLATGFPYHDYSRMNSFMGVFDYCMRHTHGLRRLGSAAADLAYVACGRLEGFFEYGLNSWDVAAGVLLVKEAGGSVSDFGGNENYLNGKEIIACNKGIFSEFSHVVKKHFSEEGQ